MSTEMKEYAVVYSVPVAFLLFLLNAYMYMYVPVHTVTLPASLVVLVRGGEAVVLDKPCLRRGSQQLAVVLHTHVQGAIQIMYSSCNYNFESPSTFNIKVYCLV